MQRDRSGAGQVGQAGLEPRLAVQRPASRPIGHENAFGASGSSDSDIMGYHMEAQMTDVLIRDIPDDVIAALDAHAARLGLSRSEYVRRRLVA